MNNAINIKKDFTSLARNFLCSSSQLEELSTMSLGAIMNPSTLTPTFDGEFNSFISSPDGSTGLWKTTMANGNRTLGSNGEQEYYSDSSVGTNPFSISNGVLDITAAPGSNALGLPYDSGVITTQGSFNQLYGYFEIDAKMPAGQGLWPAFWLLPESGAWPPELDAFEVLGNNPTTLYFSTHSSVQATQGTTLSVANVSSGFNLYGVMWGPQTVDLYINNVEVASMPTPADMNVPMYMLANLAVGGYWPGDPNSTTPFPATMQIAYIKAFAYPGTTGGTVYDTLPSQNVGAAAVAPVISIPTSAQVTTGVATTVSGVSIAANWPGGDFTVTISDSKGLLQTAATTDVFTSGEGTTSVTLTGNLAPINAALATLTYQGQSVGSEEVWISATDPQGQQSLESLVIADVAGTGVTTPPVTTSATTPVLVTPATFTLAAGTSKALSGVTVTDSQTGANPTVVISDSTGLLHTTATGGVTEQGEGSTTLTLSGGLTAIDAELATLTYQAGAAAGTDWLWISAAAAGSAQALSHTVVTVTAASSVTTPPATGTGSPPALDPPATFSVSAGVTQTLSGFSVTDGQTSGDLTVVISDSTGILGTTATSGVTASGEKTTSLTLTGTSAALNTELASLTYEGATAGTDWLWVSATDAAGNQVLDHTVVTVTPAPVVVKPIVNTLASFSVTTGTTKALSGVTVTDTASSGVFSVIVSDTTGVLKTSATSGVTEQGESSKALTLTGTLAAVNAELATLAYVAGTVAGTDLIRVSANDAAGDQGISSVGVTVTAPVVSTPIMNTPASLALAATTTKALTGISVTDSNPSGALTVKVSDSTGLVTTTAVAGVIAQGEGSTALTLTGSVAALNTELATMTYRAGGSAGTDWLWVSATDPTGVQGLSPVVVTVAASPTKPTVSLTGVMLGLSNTAQFVQASLTDKFGLLATTSEMGVTVSGENSGHLVLQGIASAVSAELATLTYTGGVNYPVAGTTDTLTMSVIGGTGVHLVTSVMPLLDGHLTT
jgi:beta-glucanase (GH16 family)